MVATWVRQLLLPLVLAGALGACASNAVQPGIISTSGTSTTNGANAGAVGATGRVVSIREIAMQGGAPGARQGGGNGVMMGGLLGAAGGATIGAITAQTMAGGLVGLLLGAVAGGIAGAIADGQQAAGRGIEVTVQRDDGQNITVAQRDDGDVQLGDRVYVVQDRQGVAKVVRDKSRSPD